MSYNPVFNRVLPGQLGRRVSGVIPSFFFLVFFQPDPVPASDRSTGPDFKITVKRDGIKKQILSAL
jgi:hypothetical protein